jgi:predicted outer membrane repeat protein
MSCKSSLHILLLASLLFTNLALSPNSAASHGPLDVQTAVIFYVKPGGDGDCTSWDKACDLQAALTKTSNPNQIWVAAGTYKPTTGTDRTATFQLKSGVAVYGGFAGAETALQQRDWTAYLTILSGDIDGDGSPAGNSYHVVTGSGQDANAVLDGFTITGGNANDNSSPNNKGGGMYNDNGSPTLRNLIFHNNSANLGGGMYNNNSSPTLTNIVFQDNSAFGGGGMYNDKSSPILTNVTFQANLGRDGGYGGGMVNSSSSPILTNVILWGNIPNQISDYDSTPYVTYSLIQGGGYEDESNLNADPLFIDSAAGNLRLQSGSPAIDTGDNDAIPPGVTTDLDGSPRIVKFTDEPEATIDIGAYEAQVGGPIIYVNKHAPGPVRDGTSWAQAFTGLQQALAAASGEAHQVWVAAGTYYPGFGRAATFHLKSGVAVYGGFAGTETALTQRDPAANLTILSGDINRDGQLAGSAYHVVTGSGTDATAMLDGFIITAGNADGSELDKFGGGMLNLSGSPTLTDIVFKDNSASDSGGGMYNRDYSSPTLKDVTFQANSAETNGGGMFNHQNSSPILTNVNFQGNSAVKNGGGMANIGSSSPNLTDVTFQGNSAEHGGGLANLINSSPMINNVVFQDNTARYGGGMHNFASSPNLTSVTFHANSAVSEGGGMHNFASSPTLTSVTFQANSGRDGGGMYNWDSSPTLTNVSFEDNSSLRDGGGIYNKSNSKPTMTNVVFQANAAAANGGGMFNIDSSPTLVNVTFHANSAVYEGGGTFSDNSTLTLTNAILWGNTPDLIYSDDNSSLVVSYSIIEGPNVYPGEGNKNVDPLFVDTAAGSLRLQATSPAIDAGNNLAVPPGVTTDLDGKPRFVDFKWLGVAAVDMGAYEAQDPPPPVVEYGVYLPLVVRR